jgi:hypothetical protein
VPDIDQGSEFTLEPKQQIRLPSVEHLYRYRSLLLPIPNLVDSPEGACPQLPLKREASRAPEDDRPLRLDRSLTVMIELIAFQQSVVRRCGYALVQRVAGRPVELEQRFHVRTTLGWDLPLPVVVFSLGRRSVSQFAKECHRLGIHDVSLPHEPSFGATL